MDNQKHTPYYYVDTQLGDRYCLMDGNDMSKQGAYRMLDNIKRAPELLQENERLKVEIALANGTILDKDIQIKKLEGLLHKILKESVGGNVPFSFELYNEIKAALNL